MYNKLDFIIVFQYIQISKRQTGYKFFNKKYYISIYKILQHPFWAGLRYNIFEFLKLNKVLGQDLLSNLLIGKPGTPLLFTFIKAHMHIPVSMIRAQRIFVKSTSKQHRQPSWCADFSAMWYRAIKPFTITCKLV